MNVSSDFMDFPSISNSILEKANVIFKISYLPPIESPS